jgi:hypothetical protein
VLPEAQLNKKTDLAVIRTIRCRSWHSLLSATQAMPDRSWLVWIYLRAARQVVACGIDAVRQTATAAIGRAQGLPDPFKPLTCGWFAIVLNEGDILWSVANGDALRNDPTFKALTCWRSARRDGGNEALGRDAALK